MLDVRPTRFRHWSVVALGGWSLLTWANRARNIANGGESSWWYLPVAAFVAGGALCLVAWWRGRESYVVPIRAFAIGGSFYSLVRAGLVLFGQREVGFKAVHLVLALIFTALAGAVLQRFRRIDMVPQGAWR